LTRDAAPESETGWRAGVAVTVPLFTTRRAGVLLEQTMLDQLTAQRRASLLQIDARVSAASALAETHRQLYLRYRDDIVPQAQQVEQVAQDAYQLGQSGIVALLQALQSSRDVRLRSLDAVSQFQGSLADLERAIGAPLP
jgi:cobalt-zinc-cadmium efflux system outer membrane protein